MTNYLLLVGTALNYVGAISVLPPSSRRNLAIVSGRHAQAELFIAGVEASFGTLYLFLFFRPQYIIPFIVFGASLKIWAFLIALSVYRTRRIERREFILFGVSNGVVGVLLWVVALVHL